MSLPSVFFATPVYRTDPEEAKAYAQTMTNALKIQNARLGLTMTPWIDVARSSLVGSFRVSECDYLHFRDQDIAYAPEVLERMLERKAPMIVAPYFVRHSEPRRFETVIEHGEVTHAGLGCALVRRDVVEALWDTYYEDLHFTQDGQILVNLFDRLYVERDNGRQMFKEDRAFCWRVRAAGHRIEALSPATVTHDGVESTFTTP